MSGISLQHEARSFPEKERPLIWLLEPSCAIPGDEWGYPHGINLSNTLINNGFNVLYWASSFSHATKEQRGCSWEDRKINENLTIRIVPTSGYRRHIGLKRIIWHFQYAYGVWSHAKNDRSPFLIYLPLPMPFGDLVGIWLKKRHKCFLLADLRDLWPELMINLFPIHLRGCIKPFFWPLYKSREYAFKNADAITAPSHEYLKVATKNLKESKKILTSIVNYSGIDVKIFDGLKSDHEVDGHLLKKNTGEIWAICSGTIGDSCDVETLIEASYILEKKFPAIKIIVTGKGPKAHLLEQFKNKLTIKNLFYAGVVDIPVLYRYYYWADIGLSLYREGSTVSMPTKAYEYISAQLPIINSLPGEFQEFIDNHGIGTAYKAEDAVSLAEALSSLAKNREIIEGWKVNLDPLKFYFDMNTQYQKYVNLISNIPCPENSSAAPSKVFTI